MRGPLLIALGLLCTQNGAVLTLAYEMFSTATRTILLIVI